MWEWKGRNKREIKPSVFDRSVHAIYSVQQELTQLKHSLKGNSSLQGEIASTLDRLTTANAALLELSTEWATNEEEGLFSTRYRMQGDKFTEFFACFVLKQEKETLERLADKHPESFTDEVIQKFTHTIYAIEQQIKGFSNGKNVGNER